MKLTVRATILCMLLLAGFGAHATTKALAEKYLRTAQYPEMLKAQVEGYTEQYAKGQDASYRKRIRDYLEKVMGWEALKDEYVTLVQETYTTEEVNAFLDFMSTPQGRSMKAKSSDFAGKLAAIAARQAQKVAMDRQASPESRQDEPEISSDDLTISKVERFQSGDQVYFTGEIKNNGKKIARGVNVEANLFLGERFVDQYSTYISGSIPPGSVRLFKISCGCKGSAPAAHDSYKLQAVTGY